MKPRPRQQTNDQRYPLLTFAEEFEKDLGWGDASTDLLLAAASLGHASAVQQLLLFDLRANLQEDYSFCLPVHKAALQPNGAAALRLLLAAAPDQLQTCVHEDDLLGTECPGWTLMHSAASSGNLEALKLLLQLAPELASTTSGWGHLPLHEAAASGCVEAVQLLLHAAPEAAAAADSRGWRTTHYAAAWGNTDCLRYLFDAGAPGPDIPDLTGLLPLHLAAQFAFRSRDREGAAVELLLATNPAAVRVADGYGDLPLHLAAWSGSQPVLCLLLAADPAAALVQDSDGRTPLHQALRSQNFAAARTLLPASHMSADQLLDAFATVPAHAQPGVQPLYADLAARRSMTPEQWQRVPAPCPGLGRALPAVLARSETEAALLAAHLPAAEAERLRISALSLHHLQRSLQLEAAVPAALVGKMLALSLADV